VVFWPEVALAPEDKRAESDMEDEVIKVCSITANSALRDLEPNEPIEVTGASVETSSL
jgi:hypothetical protein